MPYRRSGKNVLHKKGGTWKIKQHCKTEAKAKAAIRLLRAREHNPDWKPRKG